MTKSHPAMRIFRDTLTPEEQAEFEALRAKHPDWMPKDGVSVHRPLHIRKFSGQYADWCFFPSVAWKCADDERGRL